MSKETARAAVFVEAGADLDIRQFPVSKPNADMVRMRLKRSGICGTDMHILHGRLPFPPPFIPGHEFIGVIEDMGPKAEKDGLGQPLRPGTMAIACVADPCGQCFSCRNNGAANCLNFGVTNFKNPDTAPHFFGGFAELLYQPAKNLVNLPRGLNLDAVAAFSCAGPTVIQAFGRAGGLTAGELVIIQGTGPVGLFAIAYATAAGCHVGAIGSAANPARMALARKLGAKKVWDYRGNAEERLKEVKAWAKRLKRGDGADTVVEASGTPAALPEGLSLTRTRGRYLVPGQYSLSGGIEIAPQMLTFKALSVFGSAQYTLADIRSYLNFLRRNRELQTLMAACITDRWVVEDANLACAAAAEGKAVKAIFCDPADMKR